ncbi:cyclic nucleotide-binding domain-containing protein [Bdellovibrio sp. HCB337]|uniref:cyclic nucleotide-binding domain-containing protein n=1 Tax=Bdellovibrio sp. HCB337 TaxID=3394358 RepID=UPI0039A4F676
MSMKTVKKGEVVYTEGDKIQNVLLIQTGAVNLCLARNKKNIDMFQVGASQILGEQVLIGQNTHVTTAIATTETKYLEIPVDAFKAQFESSPQMFKIIMKSLTERLKTATADVKSSRMEKDGTPCPEDQIARVFGTIFHAANHKGEKRNERVVIDWGLFRQYSQRVFGESLKRLEQAVNILVKLKLAMYEMGKDPDDLEGPELIQKLHIFDMTAIENFFEFYQYYYFKGGKSEVIKIEDTVVTILGGLLSCAEGQPLDRFGVVSVPFPKIVDYFKNELGMNFTPDTLTRLENKGLFAKRKTMSGNNEVQLQFELKEFTGFHKNWRVLREVDKWNEKGFVDPQEPEKKPVKKAAAGSSIKCPSCSADAQEGQKFCGECGHKLVAAA